MFRDPNKRRAAEEVIEALIRRDQDILTKPDPRNFMIEVGNNFGLTNSAQLFNERNTRLIQTLLRQATNRENPELNSAEPSRLTTEQAIGLGIVMVGAFTEVYNKVENWVDRQNIRVAAGTPLKAYVWLDQQQTILIQPPVYDLVADFSSSLATGVNRVWSYGYYDPAKAPGSTQFRVFDRNRTSSDAHTWSTKLSILPSLEMTTSNTATTLPSSTSTSNAGQIVLRPFLGPDTGTFLYSVVRWTAPMDGVFNIEARFSGADTKPAASDVYVLVNGAASFQEQITGSGPASTKQYSGNNLTIAQGQHIDFVVGPGSNNDAGDDATAISVKIERVFQ